MNRILVLLVVLLCTTSTTSLAQVVSIDEKIITFDKLSKTVIPFVASAQPTITTEPSLEGQYTLAFANSNGTLTFAKPVQAGSYKIRLSASGKTTETSWKVLPTSLDSKSMKSLATLKLYFGKRLSIRSGLPDEADLPLNQFSIDYQLGNEKLQPNNRYAESWVGPYIPASAKKVLMSIVWEYPATGERVPLFTREIQPEQTPPEISCSNAMTSTENGTIVVTGEMMHLNVLGSFSVKDFAIIPLGADAVKRFREEYTPPIVRTNAINIAEQECTNADEIKKRIRQKNLIPQSMIDEGGSAADCQMLMNFYKALVSLRPIANVYAIVDKNSAREGKNPRVIGAIATPAPLGANSNEAEAVAFSKPIRFFSLPDLEALPTGVYEKDEATGAMVAVRGSISNSGFTTLAHYIQWYIKAQPTADKAQVFAHYIQLNSGETNDAAKTNAVVSAVASSTQKNQQSKAKAAKATPKPNAEPLRTLTFSIKGIGVDYDVPIDADNTEENSSERVQGTLLDVEGTSPSIVHNAGENTLRIYNADGVLVPSPWLAEPKNIILSQSRYDKSSGVFQIQVTVNNLPQRPEGSTKPYFLRGTLAIQAKATLVNRKAGVSSDSNSPPCTVTVNIPY